MEVTLIDGPKKGEVYEIYERLEYVDFLVDEKFVRYRIKKDGGNNVNNALGFFEEQKKAPEVEQMESLKSSAPPDRIQSPQEIAAAIMWVEQEVLKIRTRVEELEQNE